MEDGKPSFLLSAAVKVLRDGIFRGRWQTYLPGLRQLRCEVGINRPTLEKALAVLSEEGWIGGANQGRRRSILFQPRPPQELHGKLACLVVDPCPGDPGRISELFASRLQLELAREGWQFEVKGSSQAEHALGVSGGPDAWILLGAERPLIERFAASGRRVVFAGGPARDLDVDVIAWDGARMVSDAMDLLIERGHRRIVLPLPEPWRHEGHGSVEAFTRLMRDIGIAVQPSYHLPPAPESAAGFRGLLESLWKWTPPTAVFTHHTAQAVEVLCFLAARGLRVPDDVSLVVLDCDPLLELMTPPMCSVSMDSCELIPHLVRWLTGPPLAPRKKLIPVPLIQGGSIALVRRNRPVAARVAARVE